jgi:hypothetical protein
MFFRSSTIYSDFLTSEAWSTKADDYIQMEGINAAAYKGDLGIHLTWNSTPKDAPWLGVGFGWDNWTGKNLSAIKKTGAIEFWVRTKSGTRISLPMAVGLEDFTGAQAWLGITPKAIKADKISSTWTRIELPLSEFNWQEQDADASNIKQIIFNLAADGELFIDEIQIVPYEGGFRQRAIVTNLPSQNFVADGQKKDTLWSTAAYKIGKNDVHLALKGDVLCVGLEVIDDSPFQNSFTGADSYKGDGFELAFSTDPNAYNSRNRLLFSDQHLGFAFGDEITVYNYRTKKAVKGLKTGYRLTEKGYIFETEIPLSALGPIAFEAGELYGLEMAINLGDKAKRTQQLRWNNPNSVGYGENPALWGEIYINRQQNPE